MSATLNSHVSCEAQKKVDYYVILLDMRLYKFTALLVPEKSQPDVYNVTFPALSEIATFGDSKEDARFMAQDALELTILSKLEHGEKIPKDQKPAKLPKGAITEEILVTVNLDVKSMPITPDVKTAFA